MHNCISFLNVAFVKLKSTKSFNHKISTVDWFDFLITLMLKFAIYLQDGLGETQNQCHHLIIKISGPEIYSLNPFSCMVSAPIFASASASFFFSFSITSGLALATNFSLSSFFKTDCLKPFW